MREVIRAEYDQVFLLPPCVEDWIGPEHPARFIREFVRGQDLRALELDYARSIEGGSYYDPAMLLAVWLYGYVRKIRSTRGLEQACRNDLGFVWLCGGQTPDHNTLWRFFDAHHGALGNLFKASVKVALRLKLVGLVLQAVDGTKIQAACSGREGWSVEENQKLLAELEQTIQAQQEAVRTAHGGGPELPAELPVELRTAQQLRAQVQAALAQAEASGAQHVNPKEREAHRMECDGRNRFGYNAQVVVDRQEQVIVAEGLCNEPSDQTQLTPMGDAARANTGVRTPLVSDGGYASSAQFAAAKAAELEVICRLPKRWREQPEEPFHSSQFHYDAARDVVRCPQGRELPYRRTRQKGRTPEPVREYRSSKVCRDCPVRSQCTKDRHGRTIDLPLHYEALVEQRAKFATPLAQEQLGQRGRIVEPVFAQIKSNLGFRRWTVRGLKKVRGQWQLLCTSWNLQILYRVWKKSGAKPFSDPEKGPEGPGRDGRAFSPAPVEGCWAAFRTLASQFVDSSGRSAPFSAV
jgi:transposase